MNEQRNSAPVYDKDGIVLYCADCRDVLPTLAQVDHVITDPPFSKRTHEGGAT